MTEGRFALAIGFALIIVLGMWGIAAYASKVPVRLVLDVKNAPELPKHFRSSLNARPTLSQINWAGFSGLHIAGGAQFSAMSLQKILQQLGTKSLTVIDLREEPHGFLNGNAISWYGLKNAANAGLSKAQIESKQAQLLESAGENEQLTVQQVLKKEYGVIQKTRPIEFAVHDTLSEEELVQEAHLNYHRLYVPDFEVAGDREIDEFIKLVAKLPPHKWVFFHCRAGVGRTSTFMVMYDMLANAKKVSFNDIIARQAAIGGKNFFHLPPEGSAKYTFHQARLDFLKQFYEYAHENDDHFRTLWSQWLRKKNS